MKLKQWAIKQGIHYNTAWLWFKSGKIPNARQLDTGTILVDEEPTFSKSVFKNENQVYIYCRVSSHDKKDDLQRQIERCIEFSNARGFEIVKTFKEVASGMNDNRKELNKLLDLKPNKIIVEHKDRLTRFGFNYLEKLLKNQDCEIIVLNRDKEDETDLMKDLVSIITSFCCRLYGLRRGKNKALKLKDELGKI
jgi:predicted site-specific integrase-resolvase